MAKALDSSQIKSLLRHEQKQSPRVAEWPNSADRKRIHEATTNHKASVVLGDENEYTLRYETRKKSIAWGEHEVVFVQPASGSSVPCGWFRIKSLLAEVQ